MARTASTARAALAGASLIVPTGLLLAASPVAAEPGALACSQAASGSGEFSDAAASYYSRLCENASLTKAQIEHNELVQLDQQPAVTPVETGSDGSSVPSAAIAVGAIATLGVSAVVVGIAVNRSRAGSRPGAATPTPTEVPSLTVPS